MFDDRNSSFRYVLNQVPCRLGIHVIIKGHFFAMELYRTANAVKQTHLIKSRSLMGVLAVAEICHFREIKDYIVGKAVTLWNLVGIIIILEEHKRTERVEWFEFFEIFVAKLIREVGGDRQVITGGPRKGKCCQPLSRLERKRSTVSIKLFCYLRIKFRIGNHGHVTPILGRRTYHRRSADIDIFNRFYKRYTILGNSFLERVKIYHNKIDRLDLMLLHRRDMFIVVPQGKKGTVDLWMERLDPAIHHLRKAS